MRWRGSVGIPFGLELEGLWGFGSLMSGTVFRATHESSKAMRIWMGEMKKKR